MKHLANICTFLLIVFNTVLFFGTLWIGKEYYALVPDSRIEHELHWLLAPGGSWGIALGLWGTFLMVIMLLYTLRKRLTTYRLVACPIPA